MVLEPFGTLPTHPCVFLGFACFQNRLDRHTCSTRFHLMPASPLVHLFASFPRAKHNYSPPVAMVIMALCTAIVRTLQLPQEILHNSHTMGGRHGQQSHTTSLTHNDLPKIAPQCQFNMAFTPLPSRLHPKNHQ